MHPVLARVLRPILLLLAALFVLSPARALDERDLPILQHHTGSVDIFYANALRGASFTVTADYTQMTAADFDAEGWVKRLPGASGTQVWYFLPSADKLHGVYVVTWEGEGSVQFKCPGNVEQVLLNDTVNRRIVARNPAGVSARIEVRNINPANHVRNLKVWSPSTPGAGADLTSGSNLTAGAITGNLEPAPGQPEPLFHPIRLAYFTEPNTGVIRFMSFLGNINVAGTRPATPAWSDRTPATYGNVHVGRYSWSGVSGPLTALGRKGVTGMPYEDIIDLCNAVSRDLWIQVPHDTDAAYATALAQLVHGRLNPNLRVWAEYSNELWNSADAYLAQHTHARQAYATAFGVPLSSVDMAGTQHAWGSGRVTAWFLKAFRDAWVASGGARERFIGVVAGWQNGRNYNNAMLASARQVDADVADVFAVTTYFGNSTADLLVNFAYDSQGNAEESEFRRAARLLEADLYNNISPRWANSVADIDIPIVAYEGGQHLTPTGWDRTYPGLSPFMANLNRHPLMGKLYHLQWHLWRQAGAATASLFYDLGTYSTFGYWGAMESLFNATPTPKWQAFVDFGNREATVRPIAHRLGAAPAVSTTSLPEGEAGVPYSALVATTGGDGARTLELVGDILPLGLVFQPEGAQGQIVGTPQEFGLFPLLFRVVDADGDPSYLRLDLNIGPKGYTSSNLIHFRAGSITQNQAFTRSPTRSTISNGLRDLWAFGIDDASALTNGAAYPAGSDLRFYGGLDISYTTVDGVTPSGTPFVSPMLVAGGGYSAYHAGVQNYGSEDIALFVWRKDQFNNHASGTVRFGNEPGQGLLMFDTTSLGTAANELRFVVLNGGVWYISEAARTENTPGSFSLEAFNNSGATGKRWAVFNPTGTNFRLPNPLPAFGAVEFNDVQAVGVWLLARTPRYGWTLAWNKFLAIGMSGDTPPPPANHTVTFDVNGGTAPSPASKVVTVGQTYGTLATTTRAGHDFLGWFTAATGGIEVTASTSVALSADQTLYAQWQAVVTAYESWAAANPDLAALPEVSRLPGADPDGDGVPNLLEYALGGDPLLAGDSVQPMPGIASGRLALDFTPAETAGLRYIIEASSDLSDWSESFDITALLTPGQPFTHTDSADLATTPRRFLRLRVSAP